MAINPLGPLKLLNFTDRVTADVQKQRLDICLKCEKAELGICTVCFCPLAAKSWIASESCPEGKWTSFKSRILARHPDRSIRNHRDV